MKIGYFALFLILIFPFSSAQLTPSQSVIKMVQSESGSFQISLMNLGEEGTFEVRSISNGDFIQIEEEQIIIGPKDDYTLNLYFNLDGLDYGVYTGSVYIGDISLPVIVEKESLSQDVDVSINVPINQNDAEKLLFDVTLYNLRSSSGEATINYFVYDSEGKVLTFESEIVEIKDPQREFRKEIILSSSVNEEYVIGVVINMAGSNNFGTSSAVFSVSPSLSPDNSGTAMWVFFVIIAGLIVVFVAFNYNWNKTLIQSSTDWNKKVEEIKEMRLGDSARKIRKLERRMYQLEKAYEKGFIQKSSFEEGRKKINSMIYELKKRL